MKMAKAITADMEAALEMCSALESLKQGYLPNAMVKEDSAFYDERRHAEQVVEYLLSITKKARFSGCAWG